MVVVRCRNRQEFCNLVRSCNLFALIILDAQLIPMDVLCEHVICRRATTNWLVNQLAFGLAVFLQSRIKPAWQSGSQLGGRLAGWPSGRLAGQLRDQQAGRSELM